jgi:hypothetical protein
MSTLTPDQLSQYASNAGFSGFSKDVIVAIAQAESGGNTEAYNSNDPYGGSYGVLQINGAHFQSGTTTKSCALNPACAFKFAFGLSKGGTDFSAWGTYTSGSYRQFMSGMPSGSGQILSNLLSSNSNNSSSSTCAPWDIPGVAQDAISSFFGSDFFTQVMIVTVAVILALIGIVVLVFGHGAPHPQIIAKKAVP